MLSFLPAPVLGVLTLLLLLVNVVFWMTLLFAVAFAKLLVPVAGWRRRCGRVLTIVAEGWIGGNNLIARLHAIEWDVRGREDLRYDEWYLVCSNHQSWTDIFVLQHIFNRRIPFLKFFIKRQLMWVPLFGFAWWALDMPYMHRHSREEIEKNPALRGRDLETTRAACERFLDRPTSVLNFVEGTRLTPEKHAAQQSPYAHLLRPKAGGVAFVLSAMGGVMRTLLDVTIVYPGRRLSIWDLLSGRIAKIVVDVKQILIPEDLTGGDYLDDEDFRERFQEWVRNLWDAKDRRIDGLLEEPGAAPVTSPAARRD